MPIAMSDLAKQYNEVERLKVAFEKSKLGVGETIYYHLGYQKKVDHADLDRAARRLKVTIKTLFNWRSKARRRYWIREDWHNDKTGVVSDSFNEAVHKLFKTKQELSFEKMCFSLMLLEWDKEKFFHTKRELAEQLGIKTAVLTKLLKDARKSYL